MVYSMQKSHRTSCGNVSLTKVNWAMPWLTAIIAHDTTYV